MELDAEPGAAVFLVISGRTAPIALNARLAECRDGQLLVETANDTDRDPDDAPWTGADNECRARPRYPTWLDATVYEPRSGGARRAVITDLSLDGASIETDDWTGDPFFRVVLEVEGQQLHIECESVLQEETWRGVLLHSRFVLLTPDQDHLLHALVADLQSMFGEAQESLATNRLGGVLV